MLIHVLNNVKTIIYQGYFYSFDECSKFSKTFLKKNFLNCCDKKRSKLSVVLYVDLSFATKASR